MKRFRTIYHTDVKLLETDYDYWRNELISSTQGEESAKQKYNHAVEEERTEEERRYTQLVQLLERIEGAADWGGGTKSTFLAYIRFYRERHKEQSGCSNREKGTGKTASDKDGGTGKWQNRYL